MKLEGYPNIAIIGHGRHGKDELARALDLPYVSSSLYACSRVVYPKLAPLLGYTNEAECYNDRVNHRQLWYKLIKEYNKDDPARLARAVLSESNVYVGLRSREEFESVRPKAW